MSNRRIRNRQDDDPPGKRVVAASAGGAVLLRFRGPGSIVLLEGGARCFGSPMRVHALCNFEDRQVTIECAGASMMRLEVAGRFDVEETIVDSGVSDIHAELDAARQAAFANGGDGPVALLVGAMDTGKSTLGLQLVNRAATPVEGRAAGAFGVSHIELDIGQASMACPGALSATFLRSPLPPGDEHSCTVPLSFFFGDKTVSEATAPRYDELCADVRRGVENTWARHRDIAVGGAIVNTMGWVTGLGLDILTRVVNTLRVTHLIVSGADEPLREAMRRIATATIRGIMVLEYSAPPRRVRPRSTATRISARDRRIRQYFCGVPRAPLQSVRLVVPASGITLLDAVTFEPLLLASVQPRSLAAVSHGTTAEMARHANVAGFVVLLDIGESGLSMLAPSAGALPSPVLLVSPTIKMAAMDVPRP